MPVKKFAPLAWILLGALLLVWPALYNGCPFLYPDSLDYVVHGLPCWWGLLGVSSDSYGVRSTAFTLSLLPLHQGGQWVTPLVAAPALLVSALLGLSWKQFRGPLDGRFAAAMLGMSLLTPLPWVVCMVMPDLLTGVWVLSCWLWLCRDLPGWEWPLALVTGYAWMAHASHWPMLGLILPCLLLWRGRAMAWRLSWLIALFLALQVGLNLRLTGRPGVAPEAPPFLLARLLEDGTGLRYMREDPQAHCFKLWQYRDWLTPSSSHFLWRSEGCRMRLMKEHPDDYEQVCREQMPLCAAIVCAYPGQQALSSLINFCRQSVTCELHHLKPIEEVERDCARTYPGCWSEYRHSRQFLGQLPLPALHLFFLLSLGCSGLLALLGFRGADPKWRQLLIWLGLCWLANAAVCGVISIPVGRYLLRLAWLLPWVVMLRVSAARPGCGRSGEAGER